MCGFSIILILKGLWRLKVKVPILFVEQNININKNETKSKMANSTHFYKDEPHLSVHLRIAD